MTNAYVYKFLDKIQSHQNYDFFHEFHAQVNNDFLS